MRRWNPSWNFLCGAPRTWHSAGRERGRLPSKGGWIWKGRTCFTRWWGQGHLSQSRTNTNCCSWFEPVQRSWAKLRCYWTSNDPDCFAALVNRPLHFISSETIVRKVESSVSHIRIPIEQHRYRFHEKKERSSFVIERLYRSIFWNLPSDKAIDNNVISRRVFETATMLNRGEIAWDAVSPSSPKNNNYFIIIPPIQCNLINYLYKIKYLGWTIKIFSRSLWWYRARDQWKRISALRKEKKNLSLFSNPPSAIELNYLGSRKDNSDSQFSQRITVARDFQFSQRRQ